MSNYRIEPAGFADRWRVMRQHSDGDWRDAYEDTFASKEHAEAAIERSAAVRRERERYALDPDYRKEVDAAVAIKRKKDNRSDMLKLGLAFAGFVAISVAISLLPGGGGLESPCGVAYARC
ncbi:hypothetical protein CN193_31375 [Sinorhizobium meliloti]|uniref:hypothetical protein n=1 Tax=Rhizobium meliloti TaxID=382 RepID=UPI000FD76E85|nr:hypothetical protein [Sinorhizobium meliloti]RVI93127.1 hypothetical protein CN193_31375 [Sinorhizobium meliloti]